ncbi:MAG: pseudouridine synthase [Chlamydiota bacterium]|nr:pseudouridine synthase [Chlamydiota bacterium]
MSNNTNEKQRLSKLMAQAGVASRRHCEEIIFAGRVKVNGKTTLLPQTMVDGTENITIDGKKLPSTEKKIYYILNKPKGYICTNEDGNFEKVVDIFANTPQRLFTVGRLDKDTTGLIIVTNDGHYAQKVIHPSSDIEKEYIAKVNKPLTEKLLKLIAKGTEVEGTFVKPKFVKAIGPRSVKIVVTEGKKREVRVLIENVDLKVIALKRTRIGSLMMGKLREGTWRTMTEKDKEMIFKKGDFYEK